MLDDTRINELKEKNIPRLFWQYTIPSIIGCVAFAVYYIIDSIFIGHGPNLGDHALGGLGAVMPIMNFMAAVGMLAGAGTSSRISIYLGQNNRELALRVMGTSLTFTFLISLIPILIIYAFLDPILHWMGTTEETFQYAKDFMIYYLPASLFLNMGTTLTNIMKATGYPKKSMYIIGASVVANLILAPLFIFVFEWGMKGAGAATLGATVIAAFVLAPHFLGKKSILPIQKNYLKLRPEIIWSIVNIGFAPFIITAMISFIIFFTNNQLIAYGGVVAQEGYTIATRFHSLFSVIFIGLAQGIQPIIGYNYGTGNYKRMFATLSYAFKAGIGIGAVLLLIGVFFSDILVQIYAPSKILSAEASKALFVLSVTLPFAACQTLISSFFQHIGIAMKSALLSLTRQVFFFIPMIYILPHFWGIDGVWATLPLSEVLAVTLSFIVFFYQKKKMMNTYNLRTDQTM